MNDNQRITVVIPIYNGATTLPSLLESLERQTLKNLVAEIILLNGASTDGSAAIIDRYARESAYPVRVIHHTKHSGLADKFNEGIALVRSELFTVMHQDIAFEETTVWLRLVNLFAAKPDLVGCYPLVTMPDEIWRTYSFWQKAFFARNLGEGYASLTGKCDTFRTNAFREKLIWYDSKTYHTAGEDTDLRARIRGQGLKVEYSGLVIQHLHFLDASFRLGKLFRKNLQLAEALGVYLRVLGARATFGLERLFFLSFVKNLVPFGLFVPVPEVRLLTAAALLAYSFYASGTMYRREFTNPRVLILPIVDSALVLGSLLLMVRGFITGRQRI